MHKRVIFRSWWLPYLLVLPQIAITLVFFIWPSYRALETSLFIEDAFGLSRNFVWFENFEQLFATRSTSPPSGAPSSSACRSRWSPWRWRWPWRWRPTACCAPRWPTARS
jgi:ABC-type sugar transport system permease subunit